MEKEKNKNIIFISVIIVLLIIIGVLGFFLGKGSNQIFTKKIKMTIIDDKRCTNCQTDVIINQLKLVPSLANAKIEKKDFADNGVSDYLKKNNINALPAVLFNTKEVDTNINQYLTGVTSGEYSLLLGATFNPFAKRSENGFLLLDATTLKDIKANKYVKGNANAKITWLEFSDLECPFCAKLHKSGTPEELTKKYGENLNKIFNHFPLDFHANALPAAQILECLGEQKGADAFYSLIVKSFSDAKVANDGNIDTSVSSSQSSLIADAVKLGANKATLDKCLASDKYKDKILATQKAGNAIFGITGTPGNVLINNETLEYEVLSGAYPTASFEAIIDKLLGSK